MDFINPKRIPNHQQLQAWLIDPVVESDAPRQEDIRLFALTTLILITVGIIVTFINLIMPAPAMIAGVSHLSVVSAVGFITIAYVIARMNYYEIAVWLTIATISLSIFVIALVQGVSYLDYTFIFLLIPILLTGVLRSANLMMVVAIINIMMILLIPAFLDNVSFEDVSVEAIELLTLTCVLYIPFRFYRNRIVTSQATYGDVESVTHVILDAIPDMVAIHQNERYVYINPEGVKLLKADSPEAILGKSPLAFIHPDYHDAVPAQLIRYKQRGQLTFRTRERLILADGETLDADVFTTQINYKGSLATQVTVKPLDETINIETETRLQSTHALLDNSKVRYQRLLESTSDIIIICDGSNRIQSTNGTTQRVLNYPLAEIKNQPFEKLIAPFKLAEFKEQLHRFASHGTETATFGTELISKSGEIIPFEITINRVKFGDQTSELLFVAHDLTEQQVVQTVIEQTEQRFENIFQNSLVGIYIYTFNNGTIIDANETIARLSGYSHNELLGSTVLDLEFWTQENYDANRSALLKNGYVAEQIHPARLKSGEMAMAACSLQMIDLGGEQCVLTVTQDITEKYQTERALRLNESRYRAISELMSDLVYELGVDDEGRVDVNWMTDTVTRITGYTVDDAKHWDTWKQMIHPDDFGLAVRRIKKIITEKIPVSTELRITTKDGNMIWVRDHAYPILDDEKQKVIAIIIAVQDITERQSVEMSLKTHALQQAVVAELGQRALNTNLNSELLFNEVVTLSAQVLNVEFCGIWQHDVEQSALIMTTGVGWAEEVPVINLNDPLSRIIYNDNNSEPFITYDINNDHRFKEVTLLNKYNIVSAMSVIIRGSNTPLGILAVHTTSHRNFTMDDTNFLQSVANVLSAYMEQQRIRHAEQEQRVMAEALRATAEMLNSTLDLDAVFENILRTLTKVVPHNAASIMVIEENEFFLVKHHGFEAYGVDPKTLDGAHFPIREDHRVAEMTEFAQPVIRANVHDDPQWIFPENTEWIHGNIAVPILYGKQLLGVISVDSEKIGAFNERDAKRLMVFAHQASIAIRNARYTSELAQRVAERTAELNLEHRKLQSILDASGEGMMLVEDDHILYVNEALCRLTGYLPEDLEEQPVSLLIDRIQVDDDTELPDWQAINIVLNEQGIWRDSHRVRRKDDTYFAAGLTVSLAKSNGANAQKHIVAIIRDIRREKMLDAQKSRFIANASHELRSPIASLNMRLYVMRNQPEKFEYHMDLLERIVRRTNNLVGKLLDLSRFENGVISLAQQEVILQSLVEDIYQQLLPEAENKNISLNYDAPDEPLRVYVDSDRIMQVVTNLINNALNYTPENGKIDVQVIAKWDDDHYRNGVAIIRVTDTGIGIMQDKLEDIFQPFGRVAKDHVGMGLGLTISREIMRLHGGDIVVTSVEGEGSTFSVDIPLLPLPNNDV